MHAEVLSGVHLIEFDIARFNGEFPPLRHRIARVHRQIHQDLL
jgi:hypothetical protein